MFFDDEDEDVFFNNPELYHIVSRELYAIGASLDPSSSVFSQERDVPTHTEDGIPIRKLYVSNLPPKTTRTELFGLFAQYGFIKSCWLRMGERGPNKSPTPTYAFVTYSNPADAFKALQAPFHEKYLRGRQLTISPADSWHQPIQDPDGRVRWKVRSNNYNGPAEGESSAGAELAENAENTEHTETSSTTETEAVEETPEEESYTILDILNRDCLDHILNHVPILDIVRTERVSKRWQSMVQEHILGRRTFQTSWWDVSPMSMMSSSLTTAVLRRLLQKLGGSLTRLHIDHHWSTLNDRTAHIVGKFCPNLEEFKVVRMHTKNWNPLIYGCKSLKSLKFMSCNKLTDASLVQIVKNESSIENLIVAHNTHVTGLFLSDSSPSKLTSLSFYNCSSLQGSVLSRAVGKLGSLRTLRLDVGPLALWRMIPEIISQLPQLETLSLSEYTSVECFYQHQNKDFCDAITKLSELKVLDLSKNIYVSNTVLKQVANSCPKLEELYISSCNARKSYPGVTDECLEQICSLCKQLNTLDVSYLAALTDQGLAAATALPSLNALIARGNPLLTARPFVACLSACPKLQVVDASGCDNVSAEVLCAATLALDEAPRRLTLHLAGTPAAEDDQELPTHKYLTVNMEDDLSNPNLRPDFIDEIFDDSSDDSFDDDAPYDFYEEDDDDLFMEEFEDYDGIVYGLDGPQFVLL